MHIHASMYPDRLGYISDTSRAARFCSPTSQLRFPPCASSTAPHHFCPVSLSPFRLGSPWQRHLAHACERNSSFKIQPPLHRSSRRAGRAMAAAPLSHSAVHFSAELETDIPFVENAEVLIYPLPFFASYCHRLYAKLFLPVYHILKKTLRRIRRCLLRRSWRTVSACFRLFFLTRTEESASVM